MTLLVRARRKYKLTGNQVAKAAKLDRGFYRRIELAVNVPSPEVALKIEKAMQELAGTKIVTASEIIFSCHKLRTKMRALKAA